MTTPETADVLVLYSRLNLQGSEEPWQSFYGELSAAQREKMKAFVRWEDQLRMLVGKLLLRRTLTHFGYDADLSQQLLLTEYKRPYLDLPLDFNLSHSGIYVVCAASLHCRVGIDVEECQQVEFEHFQNTMTPAQWEEIQASPEPLQAFFRLWTIKESVIKAEGRGLYRPLDEIEVVNHRVRDRENDWHLQPIAFEQAYPAYLATDCPQVRIQLQSISFLDA